VNVIGDARTSGHDKECRRSGKRSASHTTLRAREGDDLPLPTGGFCARPLRPSALSAGRSARCSAAGGMTRTGSPHCRCGAWNRT
jgi:hypothetical protein